MVLRGQLQQGKNNGGGWEGWWWWLSIEIYDQWHFGLMIRYPAFSDRTNRKLWYVCLDSQNLRQVLFNYTLLKINLNSMQERPVGTGCNWSLSVLNIWKCQWTKDWTMVTVLISPENFQSWLVLVQSSLGLFPVFQLDLQTLIVH